jgi:hypothetical protein
LEGAQALAKTRLELGLGQFEGDPQRLAAAMVQHSGEALKAALGIVDGEEQQQQKHGGDSRGGGSRGSGSGSRGGGGSSRRAKPAAGGQGGADDNKEEGDDKLSLNAMWAARELKPWEAKGDVRMKLPGGQTISIVVDNLSKLVDTVGEENCFE